MAGSTYPRCPITTTSPASEYWCVDQSISYDNTTAIFSSAAGIVDTGTTLVYLASDAFEKYHWQSATRAGATIDSATGLLRISSSQYSNLSSLYFRINSITYELTPNAQIWPRSLSEATLVVSILLLMNLDEIFPKTSNSSAVMLSWRDSTPSIIRRTR